jgi:hypothetical protein
VSEPLKAFGCNGDDIRWFSATTYSLSVAMGRVVSLERFLDGNLSILWGVGLDQIVGASMPKIMVLKTMKELVQDEQQISG